MSQNHRARLGGLQLPLPLLGADPDGDGRTSDAAADEDRDWHLDPQTREIGRRGIAAARAQLRSTSGRAA